MKATAKLNKEAIKNKLAAYCARHESQQKAANTLKDVSAATISQIINGNWSMITDRMWRNIAAQIGYRANEWTAVKTRNFKALTALLSDSKENATVLAIIDEPGSSKSFTCKTFIEDNRNAYRLECNEFWNKKQFLQELMSVIGKDNAGLNIGEMVAEIVKALKGQDDPLIILDEFDKVSDAVLFFFITLYNQLEGYCGIVMIATDFLEKRVRRGLKLNKKGYKEIYSRVGRKFIPLPGVNSSDVTAICLANGITEKDDIREIVQDCENDLRRVERKIHAFKKLNALHS